MCCCWPKFCEDDDEPAKQHLINRDERIRELEACLIKRDERIRDLERESKASGRDEDSRGCS